MMVLIMILTFIVAFLCGFIAGEGCCMNTYTENLDKRQRQFEKRLMKKVEEKVEDMR